MGTSKPDPIDETDFDDASNEGVELELAVTDGTVANGGE